MDNKKTSAMAITGLVLAIIGLLLSALPVINNFAFVLALLGLIFGITGLIKTRKGVQKGKGISITAIILSAIALATVLVTQQIYSSALNEASKSINETTGKMSGEKTDELLKTDVDAKLGQFVATKDEYGLEQTKLPVTVTNKNTASKSYSIQVEAVDASGARIAEDTIYANDLGAGQTQQFEIFKYIETSKLDAVKAAQFKIVKVSQT